MTSNLREQLSQIVLGSNLSDKLLPLSAWDCSLNTYHAFTAPRIPGRPSSLHFSEKRVKFPRSQAFVDPEKRALSLHFFANHELLAIEMMATALLTYPCPEDSAFKRGLWQSLKDEQKHLKLYIQRMQELGVQFGDYPVNGFFWKLLSSLPGPREFVAMMCLTFESANLDFSLEYRDAFLRVEDDKSAQVMQTIYQDEISHVALGRSLFGQWKKTQDLWTYYVDSLPYPLTPNRAKGNLFSIESRQAAGFDADYIQNLQSYSDNYQVTQRKTWKS